MVSREEENVKLRTRRKVCKNNFCESIFVSTAIH
uniref:Uncharacterized protein n=1 Tax=Manihot esculenta TaxID=3983 RepID=A0A2C9VLR3_MANES